MLIPARLDINRKNGSILLYLSLKVFTRISQMTTVTGEIKHNTVDYIYIYIYYKSKRLWIKICFKKIYVLGVT